MWGGGVKGSFTTTKRRTEKVLAMLKGTCKNKGGGGNNFRTHDFPIL